MNRFRAASLLLFLMLGFAGSQAQTDSVLTSKDTCHRYSRRYGFVHVSRASSRRTD